MPETYVTAQGDTFDKIAYDQMDDHLLVDQLMQANLPLLDTAVFPAGVEVTIPDVIDEGDSTYDDELLPDTSADDLPDDADSDDDASYDEDPNVDTEDDAYDSAAVPDDGDGIDW